MEHRKLFFASDYMEGAHPAILDRLTQTNLEKTSGYGGDEYSEAAREKIRAACRAPEAEVFFLAGGTQANATVIDAMLRPWQGVISADTGHVSVHEAGAIEYGGHKVLALPHRDGKIDADQVRACLEAWRQDDNREHMVMPGMVYLSHPTEYGTLYTLRELEAISAVCREGNLALYLDGARLAYALACPESDVTLTDIARLCDAFYIGGTKCGTLFGEAVVFPKPGTVPHFFTITKQHGALLAKGRIPGLMFDTLFTDGLYARIGAPAIRAARRIREALREKGYQLAIDAPTNQIFIRMDKEKAEALSREVVMSFIENTADGKVVMRLCTSWATGDADVEALIERL
ncbi:MAG: aminotransferase class V-fold PLP-dependent enzyme [Clostridia bacterium]|nr:aminotransferase class V-fold PLP-dependent enzyme [Clostridia bacterium]